MDTWGLVQKSAVDPETIEQAIARLITAHENDASAHLGAGESLEAHKSADIIDHPASSVLGDKATTSELDTKTSFESLTGWITSGYVSNDLFPGANIASDDGAGTFAQGILKCIFNKSDAYFNWDKDALLETNLNEEIWLDSYKFYFGWFKYTSATSIKGLGFKVANNVIYGFLGNGTTTQFTASIGSGIHEMVNMRVMWDATLKTATFYINGTPVATLTDANVSGSATTTQLGYQLDDIGDTGEVIHIQQLHTTISLI